MCSLMKHNASLNLRYEQHFFFDINKLTRIIMCSLMKLNSIFSLNKVYTSKSIEFTENIFTFCSHIGIKFFPYRTVVWFVEKLSIW